MSGQSDHDRALERLLRAMPEDPAGPTPACIDAERLAAWSDGGLTAAERDAIDAHIASCARCLAMLSAFSEIHAGSVPAHEVGLTPRATPQASTHQTGRVLRWPLRWVVPITTAAAAVLIWMVMPARPPERAVAPTPQVARDETAAATPAEPTQQRFDAPSRDQARESAALQAPAAPAAQPPGALSKATGPAAVDEPERRRDQANVAESVQVKPAQEPAATATDTFADAGRRAANEGAMSDRAAAARPAAPPPAAPGAAPGPPAALMRAEMTMPVEIRSPDPSHRWRIRGALVEHSRNGGSTWQSATIPAGTVITAGTSPAADVCWLVGPNATVLRTTNGSRFDAANIPSAGALVSVQATDADHATVTAASGRTYVTTDGGKTWN